MLARRALAARGTRRHFAFPRRGVMSRFIRLRGCMAAVVTMGLILVAAGCGSGGAASGSSGGGSGKKVYMLLPNTTTIRFVTQDGPDFKAAMQQVMPGAQVIIQNAAGDPQKQISQVETAIANGANVIVLTAADPYIAGGALQQAAKAKVPVLL